MENLNTLTTEQKVELIKNPNTPDTTLIALAKDEVSYYAEAILDTHKKLSEDIIRTMAAHPDFKVRLLLPRRDDLPKDVICTLATENSVVSERIAERKNLSDDVKKILVNNENAHTRAALVKNHKLDIETNELLANDKNLFVRRAVAEWCELSEKTLRKLGSDPTVDVRSVIAIRKDLPRDMHETLVNDESAKVRANFALRRDLSEEHIRKLASDSNVFVVDALALNFCRGKEMPDDVIVDISKKAISATNFSMNPAWRSLIAVKEGRLPDEAMRILASSNERVIREEIAKREDLPEDIIRTLAYDPNDLVRRNIAHHKNLPDEVKRLLAADRDPVVRGLIAKSVNEINPQEYISGRESFLVEKSQRIEARPAIPGEEIITVLSDGTKETKNTAKEGDMVVNNVGSPEKWVIDADTFNRKYQAVPGNDGVFMPTGKPMQAYKLDKDVTLTAPWGEEQNIKAGGYLLQDPDNPSDIYGIGKDEFEKTYKAINENKKESFTETLSDEDKDIRREIVAGILAGGEDKDEDIRRAVAASKDPLIPEDVARALASIAKEGDTYPRVKGYNPSIEPLDEIFQKKCLESNVRRVGGKIMGMDDAMSKTIKEAQSSGKFSRNELLDYIDIVNEKHNGALDKKSMYELVDKPLKPKPSDEIIVDGIPIRRKDITPCPGSDFAVGRVTDTAYCLFNAKTNTPAGDRTTLYSYIDPEEHSGYHLVKTLPDERGNVSYNYIDHNGDKLCKKNLAFAKPFDSKGFAVVKLLGGGPLLIDNKSVVRQKAEVSTGVKLANTKGIKL